MNFKYQFLARKACQHTNIQALHPSNNGEPSSSGVKNLMLDFIDVDVNHLEKHPIDDDIMNPDNQAYEALVSGNMFQYNSFSQVQNFLTLGLFKLFLL